MTSLRDLNGTYVIDPTHTTLGFVVRHAMVTKVRGTMTAEGSAVLNGQDPESSSITVTADVTSINTQNDGRDEHLRSADFFEVEKFPTMTFTSTSVGLKGDDEVEVTGDLTIRDTTRQVTLPMEFGGAATDPYGQERVGFSGGTTINRTDFGLTWNAALEAGGVLVSDKVQLELEVSLVKQA